MTVANGLGPHWFPDAWRRWLTRISKLFFDEAAWTLHDEGYALAIKPRSVCDWKFLQAMIRDASRTLRLHRMLACIVLALFYYVCVRLFGWTTYGGGPRWFRPHF